MQKRHTHHFRRNEPQGFKKGGFKKKIGPLENINVSRFINKAEITEKMEQFVPEHSFEDFKLQDALTKNIRNKGYAAPTPIQDRIIPHIMRGSDVVGIANTGTGKTGAFIIPLIHRAAIDPKRQTLIVTPTRELALQIDQELRSLTPSLRMHSACCVGGASMFKQIAELRHFNNFIIGTPGRLKDLIQRKKIFLKDFSTLVLDEADRMLDMGFISDVRLMASQMPPTHHTLFFSASMSPQIQSLVKEFLKEPVTVSVKTGDTSKNVDQDVVRIKPGSEKLDILHDLLIQPDFSKVLIFGRTKHGVEKLSRLLQKRGFEAESIHGDKSQAHRQKALRLFKEKHIKILVATDVAARGLDIPDVSHVINYDIPATYDDYVHRIGRTGRADKKGKALTFIDSH